MYRRARRRSGVAAFARSAVGDASDQVLDTRPPEPTTDRLRAFRPQGLKETGYVEGENAVLEYHFLRLPS
jgi:hypothetical protein